MTLEELRQQIDALDRQIVPLFCARMALSAQVAAVKQAEGAPIHVPQREQEKLCQVASSSQPGLEGYVKSLYSTVFTLSRDYQQALTDGRFGLLGASLPYSYSPLIHGMLGIKHYALFEIPPEKLDSFLKNAAFSGLNVTVPYKRAVIPYCAELTGIAKELGSVNTIIRRADGSLLGHNTDYDGFLSMRSRVSVSLAGRKALVLGSGGASATVAAALRGEGADVHVISRTGEENYDNLEHHADAVLLVNATPVGMYPHVDSSPVDLSRLPNLEAVLDLNYNPAKTRLLWDAEARGIQTENGLWMLVSQARKSAEQFTGAPIPPEMDGKIHALLRGKTENIVLVGMPGCGKTTIGQALAAKLGRTFVDSDAEIEKRTGIRVPEYLQAHGEEAFRDLEAQVLHDLGMGSSLVIATGGGCVTRPENRLNLARNGTVFWLQRDISKLSTENRPLSRSVGTEALYRERAPLYRAFSDCAIPNNHTISSAVEAVIRSLP
ncbi:MAG: shikimate kinase [Faecousia sp.]